jgi:hypothetical protein
MAQETDEYEFRAKVAQEIKRVIHELRIAASKVTATTKDRNSRRLLQAAPRSKRRLGKVAQPAVCQSEIMAYFLDGLGDCQG